MIASLLREAEIPNHIRKVLGDGLRYVPSLVRADLQNCNLTNIFLGRREGDKKVVKLMNADLFKADLTEASLKGVRAHGAVFKEATLVNTVLRMPI